MNDSKSLSRLLASLEYVGSPHFLVGDALRLDPNYGHLYRRAEQETYAQGCSLRGVYTLQGANMPKPGSTPVVYVCEAESIAEADRITSTGLEPEYCSVPISQLPSRNTPLFGFQI